VRRALTVLLCVLFLSACGSGSKRLSRDEYARRADAICHRYNEKTRSLGNPSSLPGLVELGDKTLSLLDTVIADLRPLKPPEDEQALRNRWLASLGQLRRDVVRIRDRAKANDLGGVRAAVPEATRHVATSSRLATQLGMHVCNKSS
jgi:hypothetical protein